MNASLWPADQVERRPVEKLVPYARNARTHSAEQIDQIAASIKEWGWTVPILVDEENGILAGHGRILAAHKLGIEDVPVMVARGWTEAKRRAYILADNKLALNASWDDALLALEAQDLQALGTDLTLTGFSPGELDLLWNGWEPDMEKIEKVQGEMTDLAVTVKVKCPSPQADAVRDCIRAAVEEAGIEGVEID